MLDDIYQVCKTHPFWSMVQVGQHLECWPWTGQIDKNGYGYLGRQRTHRIAWERSSKKSLKPGQVVRHKCDNPLCCNPLHLLLGDQLENVVDRVTRDRSAKGVLNGRAKLTDDQVLEIFQSTDSLAAVARKFGISKWSVRDIKTRKTWGWLTRDIPDFGI